jgi:cellulose biosynthesis protein BcsQ
MPVIAVVNRKGGSGKSTLSAHLAAWCAHKGSAVMLGDVDRQQSSRSWLRKRDEALPTIAPWNVDQSILRVPKGITHVVLDTPGGLHGFDLARTIMFADIILMPVCGSSFDRESAAACHAELMALPRVASGRCKVACIGMRIDVRTRTPQVLKEWASDLGMPFLGVLRESQSYVQCLERGMTLFDLPPERVQTDLRQWHPILNWLEHQLGMTPAAIPVPARASHPAAPQVPTRMMANARSAQAPVAQAAPLQQTAARAPSMLSPPVLQPRTPASRPTSPPVVTRINSPRVLDRVAASAQAQMPAHQADAPEPLPIPSFLKLVKC